MPYQGRSQPIKGLVNWLRCAPTTETVPSGGYIFAKNGFWVFQTGREALQLGALLVPLATLAVTQAGQGSGGSWWELLRVGFDSETIRDILTCKPEQSSAPAQLAQQPMP